MLVDYHWNALRKWCTIIIVKELCIECKLIARDNDDSCAEEGALSSARRECAPYNATFGDNSGRAESASEANQFVADKKTQKRRKRGRGEKTCEMIGELRRVMQKSDEIK